MASVYTGRNLGGASKKQLRHYARTLRLHFTNNTTKSALKTAIKAV